LVFDELQKFPRWKSWLKGIYDVSHERHRFLVTGSARLDTYRRGGDWLMGRYHYWRLHPFTLDECPVGITPAEAYHRLKTVGGFPEPFLNADEREARRWRKERFERVLREDIRDLAPIRNIQLLGLFLDALRHRVGGIDYDFEFGRRNSGVTENRQSLARTTGTNGPRFFRVALYARIATGHFKAAQSLFFRQCRRDRR
jgi:hypothetical protein